MTWDVLGAGLVGSFLGAAGAAGGVVTRTGSPVTAQVRLPGGELRNWAPRPTLLSGRQPLLLACRAHHTPWSEVAGRTVLAAQNGLGQPVPLLVCFMALDRDAGGCIAARGVAPRLVLARPVAAWEPVLAAWTAAGLTVETVDDARPAQWEKAILNATVGPLCFATGLGMAEVWADASWRAGVLAATLEGGRIAAAAGITLRPGHVARAEEFFARVGAHRPSVLKDPGELPWILGALLAVAARYGVTCPALVRIAGQVAQTGQSSHTALASLGAVP